MRIWSLHPRYLDTAGLVALWREGLLAQAVLAGNTRGYRTHPQLDRFRACDCPVPAIATYLWSVLEEALHRGYSFDAARLACPPVPILLDLPEGQLLHEWAHLRKKLWHRNRAEHRRLCAIERPDPHPLFRLVPGPVCSWEMSRGS